MLLRNRWVVMFLCTLILCCCAASFAFMEDGDTSGILFSQEDGEVEMPDRAQNAKEESVSGNKLLLVPSEAPDGYKPGLSYSPAMNESGYPALTIVDRNNSNGGDALQTRIKIKDNTASETHAIVNRPDEEKELV